MRQHARLHAADGCGGARAVDALHGSQPPSRRHATPWLAAPRRAAAPPAHVGRLPHRDLERQRPRSFPGRGAGRRPHRSTSWSTPARRRSRSARRAAAKLGIHPSARDYTIRMQTANGVGKAAPVQLDRVEIDGITVRDVERWWCPTRRSATNLLGMTFLSRVKWTHDRGRLVLEQYSVAFPLPRFGLLLRRMPRRFDVSQAQAVADAQHLCL